MRLTHLVAVLAVAAGLQEDVKKVVPDADKAKRLTRRIAADARLKIEKALGEKLEEKDLSPVLYECYTIVPTVSSSERTRCLVVFLGVKGPKGLVKLGVAAATGDLTLHQVKVLENADEKAVESKHFLAQFEGMQYTENIYNAPDALAAAFKKASDPAGKEVDLLVRMNSYMRGVGPAWDRMLEKLDRKDKSAADEVAAMDRNFEEAIQLVPGASFLKATQHDKFKQYAAGARSDLAEVKAFIGAGKYVEAMRRSGELESARCSRCHGSYRRYFRDERFKHGLGNGYFTTKVDVVVPDPKLEASYQAVATGIRKAILLAAEAR